MRRVESSSYHVPVASFTQAVSVNTTQGDLLFMSGLTARSDTGAILFPGDAANQARQVFDAMKAILSEVGASLEDVVRTVTYLVDMNDHSEVQRVKYEYFGDRLPPSTSVQVVRLYHDDQLLEIEATALVSRTTT